MRGRAFFARVYAGWLVACNRIIPRRWRQRYASSPFEVIAHRGASHLAPENTLASVKLAWELGADVVEVDVHLTKDNRIVASHDPTTLRTSGTDLKIADTHSADLRELDVGSHKHADFAGESVPFLEEVLETIPAGRRLFIEVKTGPEILSVLNETITRSGKRSQVAVIGFDLPTMKAAKEIMPDVPAHWLCDKNLWASSGDSLARTAKAHGLDGLNVHWSGITWRFARAVRRAGLRLYAWTVDHGANADRLRDLGVDGIATNRPGWLKKRILSRHNSQENSNAPQKPDSAQDS
ncbi:MAG TPA: glycerophosphodiester phosphodiesterase [Sedimentisphaerales bacterium]|nr:glycerophosphodiester phosphodiesterase [Phycisphaerae bacterium]HON90411.1 glycerophosphodiester phosphodiesterase [Sedimentisphaerales bacterium]HQG48522.1 glycerophosphodiester phosphodiesterase [Sedimentisphaerales bacterium]